jgi:uncharacterized C2H2 Zn-finger protein
MNEDPISSAAFIRNNPSNVKPATSELITKTQLAERLQKSPRCVEIWMRRRYLPYVKIGHSVLFNWPDVLASLKRFEIR